jgi:hypothetical protein
MVEMVFKGISCQSYEHRSQREIQLDPVFNFSFLLDGKGSDEVRTTHASAVHKSTRSRSRTPNLVQLGEWPF